MQEVGAVSSGLGPHPAAPEPAPAGGVVLAAPAEAAGRDGGGLGVGVGWVRGGVGVSGGLSRPHFAIRS